LAWGKDDGTSPVITRWKQIQTAVTFCASAVKTCQSTCNLFVAISLADNETPIQRHPKQIITEAP